VNGTHHIFASLHELLVDDLAGIVLASLDVDRLFDDGVRSAAQSLACAVLTIARRYEIKRLSVRVEVLSHLAWDGGGLRHAGGRVLRG
jgi:hypothetical protein